MPPGRKQRAAASWLSLRLFLLRRSELLGKKKMATNVGGRYGPGHVGALNILKSARLLRNSRRRDGGFQGEVADELESKTVGTGGTSVTVGSGVPTS
jgi:hypothetical protein